MACELARAGATVVAVAEAARAPRAGALGALAAMAAADPGLVWTGLAYRVGLAWRRVPLLYQHVVTRIEPDGDGLAVSLGRVAGWTVEEACRLHADVVCLGYGFLPANEILCALGAAHDYDATRGQLVTRRRDDGETTVAGVYGVGDCCGLGGAKAAVEEGTLSGLAAARSLGLMPSEADGVESVARRRLARSRRFEQALWTLFNATRFEHELADAETLVCRCEEVSLGRLEAALADGTPSIGEVKLREPAWGGARDGTAPRDCWPPGGPARSPSRRDGVLRAAGAGQAGDHRGSNPARTAPPEP